MSEWNCGCIRPLPGVPRVRIVDEEGRELFEGYYIRHENRQPAVFGGTDYLHPEDVDHCVAVDGFADWNMPRSLVIKKVTPPHRIEVIGLVPGETCELEGDRTPEGEPLPPLVDREALLSLAGNIERMMNRLPITSSGYEYFVEVPRTLLDSIVSCIRKSCGEQAS